MELDEMSVEGRAGCERMKKNEHRAAWKNKDLLRKRYKMINSRLMLKRREWKRLRHAFDEEGVSGDDNVILNPTEDSDDWVHVTNYRKEETSIIKYLRDAGRWIRSLMRGFKKDELS